MQPREYWEERIKKYGHTNHIGYNEFYNHYLYKIKLAKLTAAIKRNNIKIAGKDILDIGTGFGCFIEYFSKLNPHSITGMDISSTAIKYLTSKYPPYKFYLSDISEKQLPLEKYDIINASDVMYHILDEDKFKQTMINFNSIAKKGCYLFISDFFGRTEIENHKYMITHSYKKYKKCLGDFKIIEVKPIYYLLNKPLKLPKILANYIAPLLYLNDIHCSCNESNGLKLMVAKKC